MKVTMVPDDVDGFEERLEYLLRPTGIMHRGVLLEGPWYKDSTGALLGHLEDGSVVALLPGKVSGYYYIDPGTGAKIRLNKRTAAAIDPKAICFYRPLPLRSLTVRDLMTFIIASLRGSDYLLALAATTAVTVIGLLPARVNQLLFSSVIPSGDTGLILPMTILLLGVFLSQALLNISKALVMSRFSTKLGVQMEAATMARVLSLEPDFFKRYPAGDLASRVIRLAGLSQTIVSAVFSTGLTSIFSLVYIGQIAAYAPGLVVPALLVILADVGISTAATFAGMHYDRIRLEADAKVSGLTTSLLGGIQKIKLAGAERRAFARWGELYAKLAKSIYGRPRWLKISGTLSTVVGLIGSILIYFFAGVAQISVANYMAFNVAYGLVLGAVSSLASAATNVAGIKPTMELVEPILKAVPETAESKRPVTRLAGGIELTNVVFSYGEDMKPVLDGISLKIKPGEYIAIVGRTGCGKSTLMRILLGFENPSRGAVYYDGIDVSTVDLRSLRRNIGVVMQDGKLFSGDIYSNIIISAPWLDMDAAWAAAEQAAIADDIHKMPMGMQTYISEGEGGISGGQKQRLLIARAIAPKPKVLMLDEATSALDNIAQRQVSESLEKLGCTRITIAHRLSTIRQCDRIVVLDQGHIVEDGTYDELIAQEGIFADLVARQRLDN